MKTKKELQIFFKIRKDTNKLKEMCYEYQQYLEDNPVIIKSKEKLEKLRECETKLANIIIAILDSQSTFSKYNTQWNDLKEYANKRVRWRSIQKLVLFSLCSNDNMKSIFWFIREIQLGKRRFLNLKNNNYISIEYKGDCNEQQGK